MGISEQNIIGVACGLALEGFKPFIYSINSFLIFRAYENIKIDMCSMNLPVNIFGVGSGYSYPHDGPTHHSTEDLSLMIPLPNLEIFNPSDSLITSEIVKYVNKSKKPSFIRLDRQFCKRHYLKKNNLNDGFRKIISSKNNNKLAVFSTGYFISCLHDLIKEKKLKCDLIDLFKFKNLNYTKLKNIIIKNYTRILTIEEHSKNFGLGSILSNIILENNLKVKLQKMALQEKTLFGYGSRDQLLKKNNLDNRSIVKKIKSF
jgi:transketolase